MHRPIQVVPWPGPTGAGNARQLDDRFTDSAFLGIWVRQRGKRRNKGVLRSLIFQLHIIEIDYDTLPVEPAVLIRLFIIQN
jgi:hypothetical protein